MPTTEKAVRQSVTLSPRVAKRVKSLAKSRRTSASRVLVDLVDDVPESAASQVLERGDRQLVAQQALRRHDDQRLAQRADHLPAKHMEHLGRRRRHADLHVVLGGELQETLEASR